MTFLSSEMQKEIKGKSLLVLILLALLVGVSFLSSARPVKSLAQEAGNGASASTTAQRVGVDYTKVTQQVTEAVVPKSGFTTKIVLGNIVPTMVADGVIDISKMQALYKDQGGMPADEMKLLTEPSEAPLVVNAENATWLVDILWPIGLSNKIAVNEQSPIAGKDVGSYASTGGWDLGKDENGGDYFNKYPLVALTPGQEARVKQLAESIYRPCCDNSTFFQDCNHGSAALALIEIGVGEGLSDTDIYQTVLQFNSFWFPQNYLETALYFKVLKNTDWNAVDPKLILSKEYSSYTGWTDNVDTPVQKVSGLLPQAEGGGSCGV